MEKLNKRDLIDQVAAKARISNKDAKAAVEAAFDLMVGALKVGKEVNITNFGAFTPKTRKGRTGTHPKQHTLLKIAATKTVVFKVAKNLKEDLNK